jgi:hypothetical protein
MPLVLRRASATATASILEFQTSTGTAIATVDASARGNFPAVSVGASTALGYGMISVNTTAAGTVGVVVRGAASQSANLQEWQNSGGTALLSITSGGFISSTSGANFNSSLVQIGAGNGGGQLTFSRATAVTTSPGANAARLYFRDGTTGGTLKLVVRAGAAGAETTILDNIPQ